MGKLKEQLITIMEMINSGKSVKDIADITGFSVSEIVRITETMQIDDSDFYDEQN